MILGPKTDTEVYRNGCENAYVELSFSQNIRSKLTEYTWKHEVEEENNICQEN